MSEDIIGYAIGVMIGPIIAFFLIMTVDELYSIWCARRRR